MNDFKLPGSSYVELVKLIRAYGAKKAGVPCSLDEISKSCAMDKTQISRNNGFFVSINLITKGKNKAPTEMCVKLAKAYSLNIDEKVNDCWKEIISSNDFVMSMINVISIKTNMNKSDFINHIIFSSGNSNTNNTRAGAAALIDIIKNSGYLIEDNDKIYMGNLTTHEAIVQDKTIDNVSIDPIDSDDKQTNQVVNYTKTDAFVQEYICSSGEKARIVIPNSADSDDLLSLFDMFKIILKRKYKISDDELK